MNNYTFKRNKKYNQEIYTVFQDGESLPIEILKDDKGYREVIISNASAKVMSKYFDTMEECAQAAYEANKAAFDKAVNDGRIKIIKF
jgi:hypothetical protein